MKLQIANPPLGLQTQIEIDNDRKLLPFFERRIGADVPGDSLGGAFVGSVLRITGGSDKDGFPMMQGVLAKGRVRILFRDMNSRTKFITGNTRMSDTATKLAKERAACATNKKHFRPKRKGEMKRKSIRGCIVGSDLSVLNLILVKKGPSEIEGLTDSEIPRRLGPKRASHIRRLFNLKKGDDVSRYVVVRSFTQAKSQRVKTKSPKIQRLMTPLRLQRKRRELALKKRRVKNSLNAKADYEKLLKSLSS